MVEEKHVCKKQWVVLLLVLGLLAVTILLAWKSGTPETVTVAQQEQRETITVSETAEIETMPNEAYVYVEIKTNAETAKEAKESNAEISDAVIAALEKISETTIETSSYSLNEERKWDKETEEYITTGYVLTHVLKITATDVETVGEIIDTAVDAGATGVDRVQFSLSREKENEVKGEALAAAAEKAKAKAAHIVDAVGVDLGEVVSISESTYYYPVYSYLEKAYALEEAAMEASTSILPQELTVTGTVTLTYEITQ